jgi:hypothetical protein
MHPSGNRLETGNWPLLAEAQRYSKALDAIVNIVHVVDPDPDFVGYIKDTHEAETGAREVTSYDQTLRDDRAKEFRLKLQQAHALAEKMRASGIRVDQALTVQGPTLETLLEEAPKLRADLLILALTSTAPLSSLVWRYCHRCRQTRPMRAACRAQLARHYRHIRRLIGLAGFGFVLHYFGPTFPSLWPMVSAGGYLSYPQPDAVAGGRRIQWLSNAAQATFFRNSLNGLSMK